MRRGQAMIECMLAVIFVTFVLFFSFHIVRLLSTKIMLDHAAARAARAKAVGFNDFMCEKSALVAMIPAAGRRLVPAIPTAEVNRIPLYLASENWARARGILDYEWWGSTTVNLDEHNGLAPSVDADVWLETDSYKLGGAASVESHYPLYMNEF